LLQNKIKSESNRLKLKTQLFKFIILYIDQIYNIIEYYKITIIYINNTSEINLY